MRSHNAEDQPLGPGPPRWAIVAEPGKKTTARSITGQRQPGLGTFQDVRGGKHPIKCYIIPTCRTVGDRINDTGCGADPVTLSTRQYTL